MYLNLKQLLQQQLLDASLTGAKLLDIALTRPDSLGELFPPGDESELLQTLLLVRSTGTITLDISETSELLSQEDVRAFVQVLRKHWRSHPFCLCRADRMAFETWRHAAVQEQQPLLLWDHWRFHAAYRLCAPSLQGMEYSIFRELARKRSANANELSHNSSVVPQRWPFNKPYEVEKMIAMGRRLPARGGPSPTDENTVKQSLHNLWRKRYVIEVAPGRYSIVRPTPPRRKPM